MSHSHSRAVRPTQLFALLLAFLSVSSLMGVAVVALPSGIITAGRLDELRGGGADD